MKTFLTLFVLLFSSLVFAEVGDVYYCEMKNFLSITNHKEEKHKNEKFTITRYKETIILQSDWFFEDYDISVTQSLGDEKESFMGKSYNDVFFYEEGLFLWTSVNLQGIVSVSATCSN